MPSITVSQTTTETPTPTSLPDTSTPEPALETGYVRIKSVVDGLYLYDTGQRARLGNPDPADHNGHWFVEDYQGSKRIKNRASGDYLAIEHLLDEVEVIPIENVWESPRWGFDSDPALGPIIIRNVWHNWEVLFTDQTDYLRYGRIALDQAEAQWILEPIDRSALSASTPTPVVVIPTPAFLPANRGAAVPWIEYEAENGQTNGEVLIPDRTFGTITSESSGRSAVQLDSPGDYVQFQITDAANSIVVRFVIPDSEDGSGQENTISLYIDDVFRQKLSLTSKYAWSYGGEEFAFNVPSAGGAHHFYDEARALVGDIPTGATVKLQIDADDTAEYYVIDLVDLELVGPPKAMPEGYLSITEDCVAIPDDGLDDGPAIRQCINQARINRVGVWIPVGTFESNAAPFDVRDVEIRGAGMWYSTIRGIYARFNCTGSNCRYADFAILGETVLRDDKSPENGFNGGAGVGSRLENIWVEHTKVGYWVGGATNGLMITGSRFRNLFADGINFCNGTSNSVIENSHFRNTGDDALASWSPRGSGVNTNNVFRYNTVQIPWRANCFAIYGGKDNKIEDNLCYDVVTYPGILVAQQFNSNAFDGTTVIQRNSLIRAGGSMYHDQHGALKIWADQGEIGGLVVQDLLVDSSTFAGIQLVGSYPITSASIENVQIQTPGTWGIYLSSNLAGDVSFSNVTVTDPGEEGLLNYAPKNHFNLIKGAGNTGW